MADKLCRGIVLGAARMSLSRARLNRRGDILEIKRFTHQPVPRHGEIAGTPAKHVLKMLQQGAPRALL